MGFVANHVDGQIGFTANLLRILRERDNSSALVSVRTYPSSVSRDRMIGRNSSAVSVCFCDLRRVCVQVVLRDSSSSSDEFN